MFYETQPINWNHPLNSGLLHWYLSLPAAEGGLLWRDLCNRTHGILTNMDATQWSLRPEAWGSLRFGLKAGLTERVHLGASNGSIPQVAYANTYTMSVWFKAAATNSNYPIFTIAQGSNDRHIIRLTSNVAYANNFNGTFRGASQAFTDTASWHYMVLTHDGGTTVKGYLDGVAMAGAPGSGTDSGAHAYIGGTQATGAEFDGWIDDARVYTRVLSIDEIKAYYNLSRARYQGLLRRQPVVVLSTAATFTGTAAATLPKLTASATGDLQDTFKGTAAATLPKLTAAATGTHVPPVFSGSSAATLPALTASASGQKHRVGRVDFLEFPSLQASATGIFTQGTLYLGRVNVILPSLQASATAGYECYSYIPYIRRAPRASVQPRRVPKPVAVGCDAELRRIAPDCQFLPFPETEPTPPAPGTGRPLEFENVPLFMEIRPLEHDP